MRRKVLSRYVGVLLGGLLLLSGCQRIGPEGPAATPIEGKVVLTRGGDPTSLYGCQGVIEFQSVERPEVRAYGEILEDGTFTLATDDDGVSREGVIEGTHRVRLNLDDSSQYLVDPRFLNFKTSGLTVKVPTEQPIEIKVWR
jgi:hypothetical protein